MTPNRKHHHADDDPASNVDMILQKQNMMNIMDTTTNNKNPMTKVVDEEELLVFDATKKTNCDDSSSGDFFSKACSNNDDDDQKQQQQHSLFDSIVGTVKEHAEKECQRRAERFIITYEPSHKWWEPPLKAWIPDTNIEIIILLILYNLSIVILAKYTTFCGDVVVVPSSSDDDDPEEYTTSSSYYYPDGCFCSTDYMFYENHLIQTLAVGLFLLLAFRANNSYARFWEGRKAWGRIKEVSRDLTRQICFQISINMVVDDDDDDDDKSSSSLAAKIKKIEVALAERRRIIGFIAAFASTLKITMRNEHNSVPELGGILCFQDILNIEKARHMPQFCLDNITYYLKKQVQESRLTIQEYCTINETCLSVFNDSLGTCERIRKTPIPLSYALQLRFFLIFWLCLYPLHLIGYNYGWYTILLSSIVDYAVLGIESMSCEIENPFGYHKNCIDLCSFCKGIVADIFEILNRVEHPQRDNVFDYQTVTELDTKLFLPVSSESTTTDNNSDGNGNGGYATPIEWKKNGGGVVGNRLSSNRTVMKESLDFISQFEK